MAVALKGMTWSHPRGFDPMVACSARWQEMTGTTVTWDQRSLQDFEAFPVEELAAKYDLIVIDHPHVGQIAEEGCLLPFDYDRHDLALTNLAVESVGKSFESYTWKGEQWALPIDAATQVQAWRPDLIEFAPVLWKQVIALARRGLVMLPLRSPHTLMSFYSIIGNLGHACNVDGPVFVDEDAGVEAYEHLEELMNFVPTACMDMDPIQVLEAMAAEGSKVACAPLVYGYSNYSASRFRPNRLHFANIARLGSNGPVGSALGGTGIAVSARCKHPAEAQDFALWIAGAEIQSGLYTSSGGQPGNSEAWISPAVNEPSADFYTSTRATLDNAWVRPRHNGSMEFQEQASDHLLTAFRFGHKKKQTIAAMNVLFQRSLGL